MSTEAEHENDLPAHTNSRVGQEPDANERNSSGSSSKTSKRKRKVEPRGNHEASEGSSESSDNDDSEDSDDSGSEHSSSKLSTKEPPRKRKRFEALAEEAQYNWDLPTGMADYANKYLKNFVPEKDIKDSILTTSPVPANIQGPKKLDDLFKELLEEKKKKTELFWDSNLERIQQKTFHVFGPLSKVWMTIEEANDAESTKVEIPLEDLTTSLEQSVMLLGQAINSMTYQRRCNALSAVMSDTRKIKSTVKEQAALFASNKDDNLFGKPFRKHVRDTFKAKKESSEVYKSTDGKRQPFRKGPSLHRGFGGRTAVFSKSTGSQQQPGLSQNFRQDGQQRGFRGKKKHENRTSPQHANRYTSDYCSNRTKKCSPNNKRALSYSNNKRSTPCRKTAIFCKQLADSHKKSRYPRTGIRIKTFVYRGTNSKQTPTSSRNEYGAVCSHRQGNRRHVEERCHSKSQVSERPVFKQSFPCREERGGKQTSYKFKESECLLTLPTFQNGGSPSPEGNAPGERLYVQGGFERCIFLHSTPSDSKKICSVPMEGQHLPISLPLFWPWSSSEAVYQTTKNTNCPDASFKCSHNNIFRRYAVDVPVSGENASSKRHFALSPAAFGLCDKSDQITVDPSAENRIFGDGDQLLRYDTESSPTKSQQSYKTVSGGKGEPQNNGLETFQFNRHTVFNSTSSSTCTVTTEVFATTVDRISETEPNIPVLHYTKSDFLAGNRMVDKQPSLDKWNVDSASNCENSHPNGCFHKGLGCPLLGAVSRGAMDFSGVQSTYQFIGTEGSTSCPSHLFKDQGYVCSTFANGQYDSPIISCQNGGYPQQRVDIHSEGNMGLSTQETDQNNCRISPRGLEYTSGHSVSTFPRFERMVAFSTSFSTNLSSVGPSGHGFVCLKTFPSGPSLYGLETRSIQSSHGCTTTKMVTSLPLCFPPIFSGWESGCKSQGRESLHGSDNSGLANTTVVRAATTNVSTDSNITATSFQLVSRSTGSDTPFSKKWVPKVGGLENFRKNLANEGVSERAAGLITNARRQGSLANYESSWGKWSGWCSKQQIDPFKCSINFVLDFLAELYDLDYKYSSINCHRSAISAYHDPIENVPVGQHPRVSSLMTGIFNQRPPQPRYSFVWDVEQVFSYLHNLPDNEQLSDRLLTLKLTMLLALASACRCSEIQNLDIRYMTRSATSYTFQFTKVSKSWKKGKPPPSLKFFQLESNRKLCVVSAIDIYLKRSLQWRAGSKHQLLLSTIQPHNEVAKSTISGWVKAVLENSGIDINIFKAHSSRSASTSKAKYEGCSLKDILKRGQWSGKTTWQKHYHKSVVNSASKFQHSLFSNSTAL